MKNVMMALALLALPPASDEIAWYYDAETALEVARKTERPIVLLKIRADIGQDVKT
jgi:hypothetical protein